MENRMPVIFLSHGSPMNAIEDNPFTRALSAFGEGLPRPRALLCVSAHWETAWPSLTEAKAPSMIYDFSGFPPPLYKVSWLPPGSPALAARTAGLLGDWKARLDPARGLDHGAWTVLMRLFPGADIPVVQLSLPDFPDAAAHSRLALALKPLLDEGIMIVGSGNFTHNLGEVSWSSGTPPPDWARDFDREAAAALETGDLGFIERAVDLSASGRLRAHPTPDHLLPLLYAFALAPEGEKPVTISEDWQNGSLSMRSVAWGLEGRT